MIALIGDSTATAKLAEIQADLVAHGIESEGIPGLPLNHVNMLALVEKYSNDPECEKIFWCCGTPWHGSRRYPEIVAKMGLPIESRFLEGDVPYWGQKIDDKFKNYLGQVVPEIREYLKVNFLEILDWFLANHPKLIILPTCAFNIERNWPGVSAYPEIATRRSVDLTEVGLTQGIYYQDKLGHFSPAGWKFFLDNFNDF